VRKKLVFLLLAFAVLTGSQAVSLASESAFCPLYCCINGSACAHCCPGKPCNLSCG
jgi:hypothetical protein